MNSRKVTLIVNPAARRGAAMKLVTPVGDVLRAHGWSVDVMVTTSAQHAVDLAAAASSEDVLVALGGDGLHGRVAAGAIESGALVAPLPAGRGHDFVRALGGSSDVLVAAGALVTAQERRVDVGLAGDEVFLGVATIGYDSLANAYANEAPSIVPSALVYAYGGSRALARMRHHPISLLIDGVEHVFEGWNVAIGNSGRYGAGMKVNPQASMTDGLLDVTVVANMPKWKYPTMLPKLYRGTHIDGRQVLHFRGNTVEVQGAIPTDIYIDGDVLTTPSRTFTTRSGALRILSATGVEEPDDCTGVGE